MFSVAPSQELGPGVDDTPWKLHLLDLQMNFTKTCGFGQDWLKINGTRKQKDGVEA